MYLNRLYADPVKPRSLQTSSGEGLLKPHLVADGIFTRMVRDKRRMVMVMKTEERLLVNVLKAEGCN